MSDGFLSGVLFVSSFLMGFKPALLITSLMGDI
jgi:hypothetical protein